MTMAFTSWMRSLWGDSSMKLPEKDEQSVISDSIMNELEFNMKEFERFTREKEIEEKKRRSSVDYSWLIATSEKTSTQIPQLERFELESLCQQIKSVECGHIITSFRERVSNEPPILEFPRIMRSCIIQEIEQRPKVETLGEWAQRRRRSLTHIKLRPHTKVGPRPNVADGDGMRDDVEMQQNICNSQVFHIDVPEKSLETQVTYIQETSHVV